jgi:CheY-like chemotaxis protein
MEMSVLMVDDDPDVLNMMKYVIKNKAPELSVTAAYSGDECLECLADKNSKIDCIISDYQMPQMNGLELLKRVRGQDKDIPFIFMTAQGNEEVAREAFLQGADDYFTKDYGLSHISRLLHSMKQAIKQRQINEARVLAEKEWEETFNAIDDVITVHRPDFTIKRGNKAAVDMLCPDGSDIAGKKCYELFHHLSRPIENCPGDELVGGKACIITHLVDIKGKPFEVKVCPVVQDGRIKSYVHIAKPVNGH